MSLAVFNGLLTSIALETIILTRQVALKIAFKTALGMSTVASELPIKHLINIATSLIMRKRRRYA
jgi:hypothetical protein